MLVIKSKKFILRPFRSTDAESLAKNINNKKIYRYTSCIPYPYTLKDARDYLKRIKTQTQKVTKLSLAIVIDNEVVGGVALDKIIKKHKAEIGYWLAEKYWGKGIITQAVKLLVSYAFKKLDLKRVYAFVYYSNKASARVLEKAGFKNEGFLRKHGKKDGKLMDLYMFGKVK